MKLIVISDIHANLPALEALKKAVLVEGYDELVHLGDVLDMGPFPRESIELLLSFPRTKLLRGNHEDFYIDGIASPTPEWMSAEEREHYEWTADQVGSEFRAVVAEWPYEYFVDLGSTKFYFVHYALSADRRGFRDVIADRTPQTMDLLFQPSGADVIFYGHDHTYSDLVGRSRYANPGAFGCSQDQYASYFVLSISTSGFNLERAKVMYDRKAFLSEFEHRQVPAGDVIKRLFHGVK